MSNCYCKCECHKPKKPLAVKLKKAYWNNNDSSGDSWIAASHAALEHFSEIVDEMPVCASDFCHEAGDYVNKRDLIKKFKESL